MLKKCAGLVFTFLVWLAFAQPTLAIGEITSFDSEITVNEDTSIFIVERLTFETDEERHGIFRYIPLRYHREGLNYTARISDVRVVDENGRSYEYERSVNEGNLVLKIGDPDVTFTGSKIYIISYQVDNAILDENGQQQLVWDITGEGWQIPVLRSSARVISRPAEIASVACFSGPVGGDDGLCAVVDQTSNLAAFVYDQPIAYNDNMTVQIGFVQPNNLVFPTGWQKMLKTLQDNLIVLLIALPGIGMFIWWWRSGRDMVFISTNVFNHDQDQPQAKVSFFGGRHVPMVYEPLKDLTPGEAGVMLDERVDNQDIIAEIIDLAHKKYLKITREETKKIFSKETDYVFTQLKSGDEKLSVAQKYLHDELFNGRKAVKVSDLKGTFYTKMAKAKELLYQSLTEKGYFVGNPEKRRITAFIVAAIANGVGMIFMFEQLEMGVFWALPVFLGSAGVSALCAWFIPAKTAIGSNYALQARGLQETIRRGAWREKIKEKHLFIEEVLPFAVSLGVIDQLSRDMEKLQIKPPEYVSSGFGRNMTMAAFVNSFSHDAASGMSYNPSSSSYSGGGSSGGGGGGGGGGSW